MAIETLSEATKQRIVKRYKDGLSMHRLMKIYHIGYPSMVRLLEQRGVEARDICESRKFVPNMSHAEYAPTKEEIREKAAEIKAARLRIKRLDNPKTDPPECSIRVCPLPHLRRKPLTGR